jgi:hypothetical protein
MAQVVVGRKMVSAVASWVLSGHHALIILSHEKSQYVQFSESTRDAADHAIEWRVLHCEIFISVMCMF